MTCFNCGVADATVLIGDMLVCDGCSLTSWLGDERGES